MAKAKKQQSTCRVCKKKFQSKKGLAIHARVHDKSNRAVGAGIVQDAVNTVKTTVSTANLKPHFEKVAKEFASHIGPKHYINKLPGRISLKNLATQVLDILDKVDPTGLIKSRFPEQHKAFHDTRKGGALPAVAAAALPFVASAVLKYLPAIFKGIKNGFSSDPREGAGLATPGYFSTTTPGILGAGVLAPGYFSTTTPGIRPVNW